MGAKSTPFVEFDKFYQVCYIVNVDNYQVKGGAIVKEKVALGISIKERMKAEEELRKLNDDLFSEVQSLKQELEETRFQLEQSKKEAEELKRRYTKFEVSLTNKELDILIKQVSKLDKEYLDVIQERASMVSSTRALEEIMDEARIVRNLEEKLQQVKLNRQKSRYRV